MKALTGMILLLSLVSCGRDKKTVYIEGTQGPAGESCSLENVAGGVNVICGGNTSFISNGTNGQDGTFSGRIELVEVCPGVNPPSLIETILELDGVFLAYLASNKWKEQRLVKLDENTVYKTTDGREVSFKIVDGQVVCL